jgi:hypothetical protein
MKEDTGCITQTLAHSFVPLTVPTILHPGGPFGLTCADGLLWATVKGKLHSCESRVRENAGHAVGIEDFQTQISARRHDFRGTCGLKIDGVTSLFPRRDSAPLSFTSDVISICDKAATKLFGKLSEADLIAFFYKDFAALVSACRPGSVQIESVCLRS